MCVCVEWKEEIITDTHTHLIPDGPDMHCTHQTLTITIIGVIISEARGLKDPHQVEFLQDQAQTMLAQHTTRQQHATAALR